MIQIIKGTFGYYNGRKIVSITEADGPQTFDPELEARLVKEGIARYVTNTEGAALAAAPSSVDDADDVLPEYSEEMKLDELKEIAAAYGVDASGMRKKADVIAAIEAAQQEDDSDGEEPPQPGAADPV